MAQLVRESETISSTDSINPISEITKETDVLTPIPPQHLVKLLSSEDENSNRKKLKTNDPGIIHDSSDNIDQDDEPEVLNEEEEQDESDDNYEFDDAFDDNSMAFGNFGLDDPGNRIVEAIEGDADNQNGVSSQSSSTMINKEQEKMELFWKLMDMGFSRERTVEAVHEKGFTDVEAAAEYLLTTGNVEGYSVEKLAPKEHKFEGSSFYPHNQAQFFKAVSREANLLKSSLPEGIYVRTFEDRMDLFSVMIHGPAKTPYEDGLFFFDVQLSPSYPKQPPKFHYHSYSQRLNPNLYVDGKVCVSLLGTWSGQGSENWDPANSNLLQVLISIQGLILVNEPYFNEPGYSGQKGTSTGRKKSRSYNEMVLIENLTSLTRIAENPPSLFHNEVREHLNERWSCLTKRLELWADNCKDIGTSNDESKDDNSFSLPDFPLAPTSSQFRSILKRTLETFGTAVEKLTNRDVLSNTVAKS